MIDIKKTFLKLIGYEEIWTLGIRKKGENTPYNVISDLKKYWYADPIQISYGNKDYVFFEMFNKKKCKGSIGVAEVDGEQLKNIHLVLEEDFHMSYPTIFEFNNNLYMLPECSESNSIRVYCCSRFPDKWELYKVYENKLNYTDMNIINIYKDEIIVDCSVIDTENPFKAKTVLQKIEVNDKYEFGEIKVLKEGEYSFTDRNGGAVFFAEGKAYVPKQISNNGNYGMGLNIHMYDLEKRVLMKNKVRSIQVKDFKTQNLDKNITGIHTYAQGKSIEVIDIRVMYFNPKKWIYRLNKLKSKRKD